MAMMVRNLVVESQLFREYDQITYGRCDKYCSALRLRNGRGNAEVMRMGERYGEMI